MPDRTYDRLAELPVVVEEARFEPLVRETPGFTRHSTVVVLVGEGHEGRGEDVSYLPADQERLRARFPLDVAARGTFDEVSRRHDGLGVGSDAEQDGAADYGRWALDSALLDLALRQNGLSLGTALGRPYRPVRFAVSSNLDQERWLEHYPGIEFKIDRQDDWDEAVLGRIAALGRTRVVDFKGHYVGDWIVQPEDPAPIYALVARLLPDAVLEDPVVSDAALAALGDSLDRIAFDAPVHRLADVLRLPPTRWLNVKPSRFGTARELFATLDHCLAEGIALYGGGQFEIGAGRPQIQALASLFYPDGPNDVAPGGYNDPEPRPGLPTSPLPAPDTPLGLG